MNERSSPTREDYIRLAAFIDGEGCISIEAKRNTNKRSPAKSYCLAVVITNTDIRLIDWCKEKFGGYVYIYTKPKTKRQDFYVWRIVRKQAADLILACMEHFLLKREQAEIGLAFQKTVSPSNRRASGLDSGIIAKREVLRQQMKDLKKPYLVESKNESECSELVG